MAKEVFSTGRLRFGGATFTASAGDDKCTSSSHGMSNGMVIRCTTTGTLPDPLATATDYYIVSKTASTFELSLTYGGASIDITDTGSGTHSYVQYFPVTGFTMDEESPEVDMTDTGTDAGTTEAQAGRVKAKVSISIIKDTALLDLVLKTSTATVIEFESKTYTGTAILYTKSNGAEVDGRVEQTYNGTFNGTVTES